MDTYNWGDLTEVEKLNVLHSWCENIDQRLRQFGEMINELHSGLDRVEVKSQKDSSS